MTYSLIPTINYGPIKAGKYYKVVKEGPDWYLCKVRGKLICVPKYVEKQEWEK
jgi:hypothetical protein